MGPLGDHVASWTLIPSSGGVFEVEIDGELVYSKKATGRHPAAAEIRQLLEARIGPH